MPDRSITPILGLPDFYGWAQSIELSYDGVTAVVVLSVRGEDAAVVGRLLAQHVESTRPQDAQDLHSLCTSLKSLSAQHESQISIAAAVYVDSAVMFATLKGAVVLKRGAKAGSVIPSDQDIHVVVGSAKEDDVLLLFSEQAMEFMPDILLQFKNGLSPSSVISSLSATLVTAKEPATAAVAVITKVQESDAKESVFPDFSSSETEDLIQDHNQDGFYLNREANDASDFNPNQSLDNRQSVEKKIKTPKSSSQNFSPNKISKSGLNSGISFSKKAVFVGTMLLTFGKKAARLSLKALVLLYKFILKIKNIIFEAIRRKRAGETYLNTPKWMTKKILIAALLIIIAIIVGVLGFFTWRDRVTKEAMSQLDPYQAQLSAAESELERDPVKARERVQATITELEALVESFESNRIGKSLAEKRLSEAKALYEEISGKEEFSELPVFYDLRLAQPEFVTSKVVSESGKAVFYDDGTKTFISLTLASKEVNSAVADFQGQSPSMSLQPEESRVVFLNEGIKSIPLSDMSSVTEIRNLGDSNRDATFIGTYDQYVYVLNPDKRNIYRYPPSENQLGDPIGWLVSPLGVSFSDVTSWSIDGSIWIATKQGEVLKFSSGRKDDFEIRGMSEPFSSAIYIYTSPDYENVYVLEPENRRVVILRKDGTFLREYKSASLASVAHFFVDESEGLIFPVSGSIVYSISLK